MNPMLQQLNGGPVIVNQQQNAIPNPVQQLINTMKAAKNPAVLLQQMAGYDPNVRQALDIVQQYNGDQMAALRATAKQYGMDPNEIFGMFK